MSTTISVVSGATGVGKSSLVATLGTLLAQRGQTVRCVGLDRQCTLSLWFGHDIDPDEGELYCADILKNKPRIKTGERDATGKPAKRVPTIADVERATDVAGLTLLPEAADLETDIIEITQVGGVGDVLRTALTNAPSRDVVLLDAPGELNALSLASIAASDWVLVVVSPTIKQTNITRVLDRIGQLQQRGVAVRVAGIVPNIVPSSRDGAFYGDVLAELRGEGETPGYPELMLPEIRRQHWEPLAYALGSPLPISYPDAAVTTDYRALLTALDERGVTPMLTSSATR